MMSSFLDFVLSQVAFPAPPNTTRSSKKTHFVIMEEGRIAVRFVQPTKYRNNDTAILFCHGNAEDLSNGPHGCLVYMKYIADTTELPVFSFDYFGYGQSTKCVTTERNVEKAVHAVYSFIVHQGFSRIIVMGKSIGSIPTVWLAAQNFSDSVVGVILISALASGYETLQISKMIGPVRTLDSMFGNNLQSISRVKAPCLIIHGAQDTTVPVHNARLLYSALSNHDISPHPCIFGSMQYPTGHNDVEINNKVDFEDAVCHHVVQSLKRNMHEKSKSPYDTKIE